MHHYSIAKKVQREADAHFFWVELHDEEQGAKQLEEHEIFSSSWMTLTEITQKFVEFEANINFAKAIQYSFNLHAITEDGILVNSGEFD